MGSCVSVQKNKGAVLAKSLSGFGSPGFGSKDEAFFDSLACIESDCEDDFFSMNGDITPSHGNTPNYQADTPVRSQLNKSFILDGYTDIRSEPSPRKKLADLLQETLTAKPAEKELDIVDRELEINGKSEGDGTKMDHPPRSAGGATYLSGTTSICGDERTPDSNCRNVKGKREKAMRCCLPGLVHSLSFNG